MIRTYIDSVVLIAAFRIGDPGALAVLDDPDRAFISSLFVQFEVMPKCLYNGKTDEVELAKLGERDFFGEMCILETLPRSATVQAVVDTTLYSLTAMTFYHLYQAMPGQYSILLLNIARDLSRRLRHLDEVFAARH